jgi:hypothetical protein
LWVTRSSIDTTIAVKMIRMSLFQQCLAIASFQRDGSLTSEAGGPLLRTSYGCFPNTIVASGKPAFVSIALRISRSPICFFNAPLLYLSRIYWMLSAIYPKALISSKSTFHSLFYINQSTSSASHSLPLCAEEL